MTDFVADIGNSRIKWGFCSVTGFERTTALPLDDPKKWSAQFEEWAVPANSTWTLAGTHPTQRDRLADWLEERSQIVRILDDYRELPISIRVDYPEKVGVDRLLNAIAVLHRVPSGTPAIIIDAGSAVTVDFVDAQGVFRGGAIFPGFRLMAKSLNDYTAKLPLIENFGDPPHPLPGTNTISAITAGIGHAVRGGIDYAVREMAWSYGNARIFLAGGDAGLLANLDCHPELAGPFLTLEGIRIVTMRSIS